MTTDPEEAVRAYLQWREDPASVPPDTADLDARIESERDPVERVKLRSERARAADRGPALEAAFIAAVASWATEHGVTAEALLAEGVERRVLAEAGMLTGPQRGATRRAGTGSSARAPRVRREDIADHVRGLGTGTTFTAAAVAEAAGGSPATVRKVLEELLAEGSVAEEGKDHSGPGRPRTLYVRA